MSSGIQPYHYKDLDWEYEAESIIEQAKSIIREELSIKPYLDKLTKKQTGYVARFLDIKNRTKKTEEELLQEFEVVIREFLKKEHILIFRGEDKEGNLIYKTSEMVKNFEFRIQIDGIEYMVIYNEENIRSIKRIHYKKERIELVESLDCKLKERMKKMIIYWFDIEFPKILENVKNEKPEDYILYQLTKDGQKIPIKNNN